jgi:hypothetical protein
MTSPEDPHKHHYSHINGPVAELLDRLAVAELCKGWPVYRDASEWANYRSLFTEDATVWTTWSGPRPVDEFIEISKAGKKAGVFIMHRECGTLVELNPKTARAVGKMKATITQRFREASGLEYDVDCDCRFIFFCLKNKSGEWKAKYVKLFYEKDKIVPADGMNAPRLTSEELAEMETLPEGYRFLGIMQKRVGYDVHKSLPTPRNKGWAAMYGAMEEWLAGVDALKLWDN